LSLPVETGAAASTLLHLEAAPAGLAGSAFDWAAAAEASALGESWSSGNRRRRVKGSSEPAAAEMIQFFPA
jgi:hypothetical protein